MSRPTITRGLLVAGMLAILGAVFVIGLPGDFSWGDHTAYYYRIVDTHRVGIDARSYSLWALVGKPFLAIWPGLTGYHVYLTTLWLLQLFVLYRVLRYLGAGAPVSAALVFAHGLGYPLRSVGLVSSPKVFWLIVFDLLFLSLVRLEERRSPARLFGVMALWAVATTAHRFGLIAAMPLFLAVALIWPNRRLMLSLAVVAGLAVGTFALLMLTGTGIGSKLGSFVSSTFTLTWPDRPGKILVAILEVVGSSGLVGGLALLGGATRGLFTRPASVFLLTFSAGILAFAILFPSGEKAMFVLPFLHSLVFLGAMAAKEPLPRARLKAALIAGGGVATLLALPTLVRSASEVRHVEGPYHDYAGGFFGLDAPRAGIDYVRDVVAGLPPGSVVHGDWGLKPLFRHLVREGEMPEGVYLAKETEPEDPDGELRHYLVRSPWMDLPARVGPVRVDPVGPLVEKGLRVGLLTLERN